MKKLNIDNEEDEKDKEKDSKKNKKMTKEEIEKVFDDSLLVLTYKGDICNWIPIDEILTTDEFTKIYKNEIIYE